MENTISTSARFVREHPRTKSVGWRLGIPTYMYAVVLSSLCVVWGLLWDIMWHLSIGRDGLLAPPHALTYAGAIMAGLFSAYQILSLTLTKNHPGRANAVPFWGVFYGSLGAMYCVWGALAMLTSAPFDDWWHNTYGLDVKILTPPHSVLGIGIMTMQFGAIVGVLALQNQYRNLPVGVNTLDNRRAIRLTWLFAISAALLLAVLFGLVSGPLSRYRAHHSSYYGLSAILLPCYLLAVGRASLLRWPVTIITGLYMIALLLPSWILQNFPATPRLGPILNPVTHYQPFHFPMLLVIPAFVLDWLMHHFEVPAIGKRKLNDWVLAGLYGTAFMIVLLAVQWPFGEFLVTSPYARNGIFLSYMYPYYRSPDIPYRYAFAPSNLQLTADFLIGFGKSLIFATLSARVGLLWGNWMKRVVR